MIVSKTPLRMSFAGGGSDISSFYLDEPGSVISTTIDKYVNVCINPKFDDRIRLSYSKTEDVFDTSQIEHPIVKEVLLSYKVNHGIEIASLADIPSNGTGLGSSSSFTVGLINAIRFSLGKTSTPNTLAEQACYIEIERLNSPIGKQDQYAAAFGGLNFFQFMPDGSVISEKLKCNASFVSRIEKQIIVFYTGLTRSANDVLSRQKKAMENSDKKFLLKRMVELSRVMKLEFENGNSDSFGQILHENWCLKSQISKGISSPQINQWYDTAMQNGATGGKLLGAGSGGFLMFAAPPDKHDKIASELLPLKRCNFRFDPHGSRIVNT